MSTKPNFVFTRFDTLADGTITPVYLTGDNRPTDAQIQRFEGFDKISNTDSDLIATLAEAYAKVGISVTRDEYRVPSGPMKGEIRYSLKRGVGVDAGSVLQAIQAMLAS